MKNTLYLLPFFVLILSSQIFAATISAKVVGAIKSEVYDVGIGSTVSLDFSDNRKTFNSLFLGKMVGGEKGEEYLFLDETKTKIYMIDAPSVKFSTKKRLHEIVQPIDQGGETCAAYAIFHFWRQMHTVGFKGSADLSETMTSERGRMRFLETSIESYYISDVAELDKIMKANGKRFGFNCKAQTFKDPKLAADFLYNKASVGKPVMFEFNIGSDMVTSTYEVSDYENPGNRDPRLWVPRITGQRANGGHVIVAAGAFTTKGRKKILILDSDWAEPRVWDLQKQLGSRTAIKEMNFYSCN